MGFKRLVSRRRAVAAATTEIAPADPFQAEPMTSTEQETDEVTAATVAGEPPGEVSLVAAATEGKKTNSIDAEAEVKDKEGEVMVDCKTAEVARIDETGMEAESDEEDPVETESVADETNAADEIIEADEDPDEVENEDEYIELNDGSDFGGSESDDSENDEVDPSLFTEDLASDGNNKEVQIFIGGLPKDCVEEDIRKVFSEFGKTKSINIVKNPLTNRIKGFAFVRYANTGDAMKALATLNDGTKVKGKKVRIAASQDNNTLYLGNICKTWTKDQVRKTLNGLGIEELEMNLPDDLDSGGRNKGFAFVQFANHSDAMAAFHRLRKSDAIFGMNRSAKVSFAKTPLVPSEDLLMKVKTVCLEHVPLSWGEEKIEQCCKKYGAIKRIALFRKLKRSKKKDISFVEFHFRNNALACVQGINNAKIGRGEMKVVASLARPVCKGRLANQGTKGGYKVNRVTTVVSTSPSEQQKAHEDDVMEMKHTPCKLSKGNKRKHTSQGLTETQKASQKYKGKRQARGSMRPFVNGRPAKKERKMCDVPKSSERDYVSDFGSPRTHAGQSPLMHMIHLTGHEHASNYQALSYSYASGSHTHRNDLEPHAGYIPITNHARRNYADDPWRTAHYSSHRISVPNYIGGPTALRAGYASYTVFQPMYAYPAPSGLYPSDGLQNHTMRYC